MYLIGMKCGSTCMKNILIILALVFANCERSAAGSNPFPVRHRLLRSKLLADSDRVGIKAVVLSPERAKGSLAWEIASPL